jgi:molecular chaperone GrpE
MEKIDAKKLQKLFHAIKKELGVDEKAKAPTDAAQTPDGQNGPEQAKNASDQKHQPPIVELEQMVDQLVSEVNALEEKRLMAVADSHDTVRRFQNESQQIKKYGGENDWRRKSSAQLIHFVRCWKHRLTIPKLKTI